MVRGLRWLDGYRKFSPDRREPTWIGAGLSIIAVVLIAVLFGTELKNYVAVDTTSSIITDKRSDAGFISIEFNISFPALPCRFASVDVTNILGMNRLNITKTIHKFSIDPNLEAAGAAPQSRQVAKGNKHDENNEEHEDGSISLHTSNFDKVIHEHDIMGVFFFTTWAPPCQTWMPAWESAAKIIRDKYNTESDGRIRLGTFDCTTNVEFCKRHKVKSVPSYRIFRGGRDFWDENGHYIEEVYRGDRDTETLVEYFERLVADAKNMTNNFAKPLEQPALSTGGCRIEGFVDVHVPVYLVFSSRNAPQSFDASTKNMSHVISQFIGRRVSSKETNDGKRIIPYIGRNIEKMVGYPFIIPTDSPHVNVTIEHHIQIVETEIVRHRHSSIGDYDYWTESSIVQSHDIPMVKFHIQLCPIKVLVTENGKSFIRFTTSVLAFAWSILQVGYMLYHFLNAHEHTKTTPKKGKARGKGKKKCWTA